MKSLKKNRKYDTCKWHILLEELDPRQDILDYLKNHFNRYIGVYDIKEVYVYWSEDDARYTVLLRYDNDLSFEKLKKRQLNIIYDVFDFCECNDLTYDLRKCSIHYTRKI